ncbi:MAG: M48 family metallopeptidase [Clostridiaceae bacterium]
MYIQYNEKKVDIIIKKTQRKTIGIKVEKDKIKINSPIGVNNEQIIKLLKNKNKWVIKSLEKIEKNQDVISKNNNKIMLKGNTYDVELIKSNYINKPSFLIKEDKIIINSPILENEYIKKNIEFYLKNLAYEEIKIKVEYYNQFINGNINAIKVKNVKTRWGSLSSKGNLNFNYRLIMAPAYVLDYVVVHELCHFIYFDHSRAFWSLVKSTYKETDKAKEYLKQEGYKLLSF